jgi:hypothetical protein
MRKIATIWGNHRNDEVWHTDHSFWEASIKEDPRFDLTRFTWQEWPDMPRTFDLYLFLDFHPSLYRLPRHRYQNTAFYWWDSFHFSTAYTVQVAPCFDRAYFAEKLSVDDAKRNGIEVSWLPMGYYPGVYHPLPDVKKVHDYAFIGQQDDVVARQGSTRRDFLLNLSYAKNLHGYIGGGVYGERANLVLNEAKVLFDRTIYSNVGSRFFLAVGSGGFTLMNRLREIDNGLDELAVEGVHYAGYDDTYADFEKKLRHYLEHEDERIKISQDGHEHFRKEHTYARRLETILKDFHLL